MTDTRRVSQARRGSAPGRLDEVARAERRATSRRALAREADECELRLDVGRADGVVLAPRERAPAEVDHRDERDAEVRGERATARALADGQAGVAAQRALQIVLVRRRLAVVQRAALGRAHAAALQLAARDAPARVSRDRGFE